MGFRQVDPLDFTGNPFRMIGKDWMLVAAEKEGRTNAMTASWGGIGVMWGRNVSYVVIRPQRFTKEFVDASDVFSLNFLDPAEYRRTLGMFGSVSGRDADKVAEAGLTVEHEEGAPYFAESRCVMICRKLFAQPYDPAGFIVKEVESEWYPEPDHHTLYISEVVKILEATKLPS